MNPARVAQLLRELADELDGGGAPRAVPKPRRAPQRRRQRSVAPPAPDVQPTELDRARARAAARRQGILVRP